MNKFSFNKQYKTYATNATLQYNIARKLVKFALDSSIKSILDLGAGNGNVALNLSSFHIDYFLGIDNSSQMLSLHPINLPYIRNIKLENINFEDYDFACDADLIISSSALHWACNLERLFMKIAERYGRYLYSPKIAFSVFTNNSLASLHSFLGTTSPLRSSANLTAMIKKYFVGEFHIEHTKKHFSSTHYLLAHLKYCGLLGGGEIPYKDKKRLKFDTTLLDLEYEILYFVGNIRRTI